MSEISISAKALPKFPPIRENSRALTVVQLLGQGPEKWSKGAKYRDISGNPIDIADGQVLAFKYDIIGAIDFIYSSNEDNLAARIRVGMELKTTPTMWNDSPATSYEDLMNLVRRCNI